MEQLEEHGYYPVQYTPGLWHHKWCPVTFALVVDNFGVKITGENHGKHLIKAIEEHYEITVDKGGKGVLWYTFRLGLHQQKG
eukprot:13431537-Ditylum_brightwellii.AAC.2